MADKDLTQGQQLNPSDKTRYVEIDDGVYALAMSPFGSSGKLAQDIDGALVAVLYQHHEIHEGSTFLVSYKSPDAAPVADNGTILFIITTHAKYAHMAFRAACGGDMEGELYEGTTVTAGTGFAMVEYNKNRASAKAATVGVRRQMTIVAVGTLIENEFVPGGTGPQAVGGAAATRAEWVLAPNTVYMVRITNRAGNAQPMSLAIEWYEESVNA